MKNLFSFLFYLIVSVDLYAAIPQSGTESFDSQILIAKNEKFTLSIRWQALVKAAEVAHFQQISEIKKFARHKDWYMRNAALVALEKINVNHAMEEAQLLLKDKALVVRSAAVDVIARRYTIQNRDLLVAELNQPYNFKKKNSLWIRPQIFNIIAAKAQTDDRTFFTKYLFDSDPKIAKTAVATLERITDVHFDQKNQIQSWQAFVKKNGWL